MQIVVNGKTLAVAEGCTLAALLEQLAAPGRGVAVARNDAVVPRSAFASERLREGDRIEIIQAVAGG